ncbi:hypothetical protein ES703_17201 [subsurface metagenome]
MSEKRKFQAVPPPTIKLTDEAFEKNNETAVYWLTGSGMLINSHGTTIMVDPTISLISENPPLGEVFDDSIYFLNDNLGVDSEIEHRLEQLTLPPIYASEVKKLDAVLFTHSDDDHLGAKTVVDLLPSGATYHGTDCVKEKLIKRGVPKDRICVHKSKDKFTIGSVDIQMTAAYHPWQENRRDEFDYVFTIDDCCGYKFYTQDGVIWHPGDSLLLDEHFENDDVDLMFIDLGDDTKDENKSYHFGRKDGLRLVNHLVNADLVLSHWGTYYGPEHAWCNCNPDDVRPLIKKPERFHVLAAGEKYLLKKKQKQV